MSTNTIKLRFTGLTPLLMSADILANPLDPKTIEYKKLTSKKKKTIEDLKLMQRLEWEYSFYIDEEGPFIPNRNLKSCLIDGAKYNKLGATFGRGLIIVEDKLRLKYKGPKELEKMWKKGAFSYVASVVVGRAKLFRARPIFEEWSFEATISFYETLIDKENILMAADTAGMFAGIGSFRPDKKGEFGRFKVEEI